MNSQIGEERIPFSLKLKKDGVHRTNLKCWEKKKYLPDSDEGRIFSYLRSDGFTQPFVPDLLPGDWETRGHSMWSLRLWETRTIKEFWAMGCETGLEWQNSGNIYNTLNDMAFEVGAYYTDQQRNHVHVYMGNRTPVWFGGLLDKYLAFPSAISHIMQSHYGYHLEHALIYGPNGTNELKVIWGDDLDKDGWADNTLQW